jgi:hypothetical protein
MFFEEHKEHEEKNFVSFVSFVDKENAYGSLEAFLS